MFTTVKLITYTYLVITCVIGVDLCAKTIERGYERNLYLITLLNFFFNYRQ